MEFVKGEVVIPKTIKEIVDLYNKTREGETFEDLIEVEGHSRVFEYKNEWLRRLLRDKYDSLLPDAQRLAIDLCKLKYPVEYAYERQELVHDWSMYCHKNTLERASEILNIVDYETAINVIKIFLEA